MLGVGQFLDVAWCDWLGDRFAECLLGLGLGHVGACRHVDGLFGVSAKEGIGGTVCSFAA